MRKQTLFVASIAAIMFLANCNQQEKDAEKSKFESDFKKTNGYESVEAYGEHLVTICGCNDCHSPKKMGPNGPEIDSILMLSGYQAKTPAVDVDRKAMAAKGIALTQHFTEWIGPWGVSYTANLTPDETGIGSWNLDQFKMAIRQGKFHGQPTGRTLLPPMPWEMFKHMTDEETAAVFAYLKSLKPVSNLVPPPLPPAQ